MIKIHALLTVSVVSGSRYFFLFKGAMSPFMHLETFSLNFSSLSFAIRVNLLHP